LLDISRITEGKIELRKKVVTLESILTAAASTARPEIEARGQKLAVTLPPEPIFLHADATRLEQVFGNLLANACKYSDSGCHISLTAERGPAHETEPTQIIVRVRDDGIGIAPELLPRIFDLFVQATRALDRAHGGLGIGLTIVHRLVTLHGGSVEARSEGIGCGSEFIVRLPTLTASLAAPNPPPSLPLPETARRILIVDDNEDSARSMATLQRLRGHETRAAFTGPDALIAAAEFIPEIVLLDIGLPGMDGFEVARRLRAMPALGPATLVAMTGYESDKDRALARAAGFDQYLVKPVDLEVLRGWLSNRP
jgi:CheY-like chemotaxis protein